MWHTCNMTCLHFLIPYTIINCITFQYKYVLTDWTVTLQNMQPDSKHLNKAYGKSLYIWWDQRGWALCVCVILMFSTCWAVWKFDPLTRAAQLSPVSPALSIDQQSLRHETATGNLSGGRHTYFTTSNIAVHLLQRQSYCILQNRSFIGEQTNEMAQHDYTISLSKSIWKCLQLYYCRSQ